MPDRRPVRFAEGEEAREIGRLFGWPRVCPVEVVNVGGRIARLLKRDPTMRAFMIYGFNVAGVLPRIRQQIGPDGFEADTIDELLDVLHKVECELLELEWSDLEA